MASKVDILLATYNGQAYLPELLKSLEDQSIKNWRLLVSDDGSNDDTIALIREFARHHAVEIFEGPGLGPGPNFISLAQRADGSANYYAFCDQDDIWLPDKLQRAVENLEASETQTAALYCSRQKLIDEAGHDCGMSRSYSRPPSFRNALVENIATGCTVVMNQKLKDLLAELDPPTVKHHDWMAYLLATGTAGTVIYDPEPSILYRQHPGNTISANTGLRASLDRAFRIFKGEFGRRFEENLTVLQGVSGCLAPHERRLLKHLSKAIAAPWHQQIQAFSSAGLYRQSTMHQVSLWCSITEHSVSMLRHNLQVNAA